jgi:hypothetical protein
MSGKIYRIYADADATEHICCTLAESEAEALELVRGNAWACQQMGEGCLAVETEEI